MQVICKASYGVWADDVALNLVSSPAIIAESMGKGITYNNIWKHLATIEHMSFSNSD